MRLGSFAIAALVSLVATGCGGDDKTTTVGSPTDQEFAVVVDNASQLVNGNQVFYNGETIGSVREISLTDGGRACIVFSDSTGSISAESTLEARIAQGSLSSVAGRELRLEPSATAEKIREGCS